MQRQRQSVLRKRKRDDAKAAAQAIAQQKDADMYLSNNHRHPGLVKPGGAREEAKEKFQKVLSELMQRFCTMCHEHLVKTGACRDPTTQM